VVPGPAACGGEVEGAGGPATDTTGGGALGRFLGPPVLGAVGEGEALGHIVPVHHIPAEAAGEVEGDPTGGPQAAGRRPGGGAEDAGGGGGSEHLLLQCRNIMYRPPRAEEAETEGVDGEGGEGGGEEGVHSSVAEEAGEGGGGGGDGGGGGGDGQGRHDVRGTREEWGGRHCLALWCLQLILAPGALLGT